MVGSCIQTLPDYAVQANGGMALAKVGITRVKQYRRDFSGVRALTKQSAYVDLNGHNGIHMSRLRGILNTRKDGPITLDGKLLLDIRRSQGAKTSFWDCEWETAYVTENEQELFIK